MENENKLKNKNVKTYTDEMVKAIESGEGGMIKKIIHEEEQHENEKSNLSPKSKKNKVFMLISILLLFLSLALLFVLTFLKEEINTITVAPQFTSLIFNDQTDFKAIDELSKDKIAEIILEKINNTKVKIGGIEGIYLTENKKVVGLQRFNNILKSNLVLGENKLFDDNFLLGVFKSGVSSVSPNIGDLFMLIKIRSFTDAFTTMHEWEHKMLYDLGVIWGIKISPDTNYLFTKNFEDGIVENKNARILKDNEGNTVLMYVFANDDSIIITKSNLAVREVILRLFSTKIKK
ncbi:MAG: hypothetical protein NDI62_00375 [Burkholderiales bacterium]|nr:hypothetical protein [Burkholderiales bacterium]